MFQGTNACLSQRFESSYSCILCRLPVFLLVYETLECFKSSNKGDASTFSRPQKNKERQREYWEWKILRVTCRKCPWELITTCHLISANGSKYHNALLLWDNSESLRVFSWLLLEFNQVHTQTNRVCVPVLSDRSRWSFHLFSSCPLSYTVG